MSDRTESTIVIEAPPADVLAVITDYEKYPEWTGAVKEASILERDADGHPRQVRFVLDAGAIRDTYTLAYERVLDDEGAGTLSWTLVDSTVLKSLDGAYELAPIPEGTAVRYQLAVDLRVPMLGMLRRKAEKVIIDTALSELKKQVEAAA